MAARVASLYKLQKKDVRKAGAVLADAFQHDPVWKTLLEEAGSDLKDVYFQGPVSYGLRYGEAYAPSENLEGVAVWVPGNHADMTLWRMIRIGGSLRDVLKVGLEMMKFARKMLPVFEPIEADRRENMKGREYTYLMIIGVATEFQGRGFGSKLLRALLEESDRAGVPIYLETETERNVRMYERLGFRTVNRINLPLIELPMWEMVREPVI